MKSCGMDEYKFNGGTRASYGCGGRGNTKADLPFTAPCHPRLIYLGEGSGPGGKIAPTFLRVLSLSIWAAGKDIKTKQATSNSCPLIPSLSSPLNPPQRQSL